jgi:hypothetical protein
MKARKVQSPHRMKARKVKATARAQQRARKP